MTGEDLKRQMAAMGLKPDDKLMLHSSMKAIGEIEGGADAVIDAFTEYLCDGLFMTPAHTWKQMSATYNLFDPATEPSCVGIISNLLLRKPGSVRSLHPTHSIAAYGPGAASYVAGDENFHTPCDPKGCFGRLRDVHAKILLAGVTHARNTYIHSIEESFDIPERFTATPVLFKVKMPDGTLKPVEMYRHYNPRLEHISEAFDKLGELYLEKGAVRRTRLGNADCLLCDAGRLFEVTGEVLRRQPDFFIPKV